MRVSDLISALRAQFDVTTPALIHPFAACKREKRSQEEKERKRENRTQEKKERKRKNRTQEEKNARGKKDARGKERKRKNRTQEEKQRKRKQRTQEEKEEWNARGKKEDARGKGTWFLNAQSSITVISGRQKGLNNNFHYVMLHTLRQ